MDLKKRALAIGLPEGSTLEEVERAERELSELRLRAQFVPKSLDKEKRTIDVVFATDTPVRMYSWEDGPVNEVLSFEEGHVRLERINGGAPVLDNHDRSKGTKGVLGVIEKARIENGQGIATLRFSSRASNNELWQDIEEGIIRGVSAGYRVFKYEITKEDGKLPVYRAIDWEPFEISMAPVQADPLSQVRSLIEKKPISTNKKPEIMDLKERAKAVNLPEDATLEQVEAAEAKARKAAETASEEKARKAAEIAERTRSTEILTLVRKAGLDAPFAENLVKDGKNIEEARALIFDELEKRNADLNPNNRTIIIGAEQKEKVRKAMEAAIILRVDPSQKVENGAEEFRGMSLMDMAKFSLEQCGINHRGMSRREIATIALGVGNERQYHSSSDFPIILANTVNKRLRAAYAAQQRTFQPWTRRTSFSDFKLNDVVQLSGLVGDFDKIEEGGEYKAGSLKEAKESYKLAKYGKLILISWETLINDDLSAFNRIPAAIAAKAANKQSDIVYGILLDNAAMSDSVALFHADHGNLAGSGTAIGSAGLSAGRAAMRKQKGLEGDYINLSPKFLLCGPDKETEAQQILNATIVAAKSTDTNVFRNSLELITEARLTGNQWYLSADPNMIDTIEYAFLDGEQELFTEQRTAFEKDGLEIKARMVFAAKSIDFRGLYKNPGA